MEKPNFIYNSIDILSQFLLENHLILDAGGHQFQDPSSVCSERIIEDFELIYTVSGNTYITMNQRKYIMHGGDLILIKPFVPHEISTEQESPHETYWFHFSLSYSAVSENFIDSILLHWTNPICHIGLDERLLSYCQALDYNNKHPEPGDYLVRNAVFYQIFIYILNRCNYDPAAILQPNIRLSPLMSQLIFICAEKYASIHSTSELAEKVHISASYCFYLFRKEMGISPAKYLAAVRLREAARMVRYTDLKMESIAELTGYSSPYHLSNIFRQNYHKSPGQYRKDFSDC